jgi:ribosome recycling factor
MKDEILSEMSSKMEKTIEALDRELKKMRTGRASTSILEGIKVECYGTQMLLNQVASFSSPESRLLIVQPWDQSIIGDIEKSILKSGLGLTPMNDGKLIRIAIPPLTEERRKELAKMAKKTAEDSKVAIRNQRREANEMLKDLKKEGEISEDEMYKYQDKVQKITDEFIERKKRLRYSNSNTGYPSTTLHTFARSDTNPCIWND